MIKMKFKLFKVIFLICIMIVLNCSDKNSTYGLSKTNTVRKGAVQKFGNYSFIIRFSNLIYVKDGKKIKIPIFHRNMGDGLYDDFLNYCYENNLLNKEYQESGFVVKTPRGQLRKNFHGFIKFYKSNILKEIDVNKPSKMIIDDGVLDIYYDFEAEDIPFVLQITVYTEEDYFNTRLLKSVFDVKVDENMKTPTAYFKYSIYMNQTSKKL